MKLARSLIAKFFSALCSLFGIPFIFSCGDNGIINKTRYTRLLESHLSLDNAIKFLKSNDLTSVRNIVLCHLSDTNSNEKVMQKKVFQATKIVTTIARPGLELELKLYPF